MPDDSIEYPKDSSNSNNSPLKSLFDSWEKNRDKTYSNRDGQHHIENDVGSVTENERETIKRLAQEFDRELLKFTHENWNSKRKLDESEIQKRMDESKGFGELLEGKDYRFFLHHQTKQGHYPSNEVTDLTPEEQFVNIELIPSPQVALGKDLMMMSTSPIGRVPVFFVGTDGQRYQAKNTYKLNPFTGKGCKVEEIWWSGDDTWGQSPHISDSTLKRVDFEMDRSTNLVIEREVDLEPGDFEQLSDILGRMQSGEITLLRPTT